MLFAFSSKEPGDVYPLMPTWDPYDWLREKWIRTSASYSILPISSKTLKGIKWLQLWSHYFEYFNKAIMHNYSFIHFLEHTIRLYTINIYAKIKKKNSVYPAFKMAICKPVHCVTIHCNQKHIRLSAITNLIQRILLWPLETSLSFRYQIYHYQQNHYSVWKLVNK